MRIVDWANRCKQRRHDSFTDCERLSSSSSSDCCAGQRSTPHSRTLEVRPGRITRKLGLRYDCDCERDETKSLLGVLMLGCDILIANDEWLIKINGRSVRLSVCLSVCLSTATGSWCVGVW